MHLILHKHGCEVGNESKSLKSYFAFKGMLGNFDIRTVLLKV